MNPINSKSKSTRLFSGVVNSIESVWATAWGEKWERINVHIRIPAVSKEKQSSLSYYDAMKLVEKHYDTTGD